MPDHVVSDRLDQTWLEEAVDLGRRGWGSVRPNPLVGCVLVKEGVRVGSGWHRRLGGPHAEVWALEEAGEAARGCTAYVSLEPCNHQGRTPPCTAALVSAGVERVVYGSSDPGGESGGGAARLREAGIEVRGPSFDTDRARRENPAFFHWADRGTPLVALKLAQTLDGKIARPGEPTRITGDASERHVHALRRGFDAIMVGSGTARVDNPRLSVRHGPAPVSRPARVLLDSRAAIEPSARIFEEAADVPVHVFVGPEAPPARVTALEGAGAQIHRVEQGEHGLDLQMVMARLGSRDIRSVMCEGGGRLAASLLAAGSVERLYLYVAPWVMGRDGVAGLSSPAGPQAWSGWRAMDPGAAPPFVGEGGVGSDALLVYRRSY